MGQFLPGEETKLLDAAEGHNNPTTPHAASGSSTLCSQEDKHPQEDSQEQLWERFPLMRSKSLEDSASSGFFCRVSGSAHTDLRGDVDVLPVEMFIYLYNSHSTVLGSLITVFIKLPGKLHKRKYCIHFNYRKPEKWIFSLFTVWHPPPWLETIKAMCVCWAGNFDVLSNFLYYFPFWKK